MHTGGMHLRTASISVAIAVALVGCGGGGEEESPGDRAYEETYADCLQEEKREYWLLNLEPGQSAAEALQNNEVPPLDLEPMEERCDSKAERAKADVERGDPGDE
jgi:hypothetical protein